MSDHQLRPGEVIIDVEGLPVRFLRQVPECIDLFDLMDLDDGTYAYIPFKPGTRPAGRVARIAVVPQPEPATVTRVPGLFDDLDSMVFIPKRDMAGPRDR